MGTTHNKSLYWRTNWLSDTRSYQEDLAASLKTGVFVQTRLNAEAFKAITEAIDPAAHDGLIEIEILKKEQFRQEEWVLRDGNAVAVNQLGLRLAFFDAYNIFMDSTVVWKKEFAEAWDPKELMAAMNIYALLHPEHQQAVSWRKRIINEKRVEAGPGLAEFERLVRHERRFIDSLLTSPLNKINKSPTLWAHRRWLVPTVNRLGMLDVPKDMTNVVMVSGEKHPRNYYAWHHARYLMTFVDWGSESVEKTNLHTTLAVLEWCKRHHDDTSGWSFLQGLLLTEGRYELGYVTSIVQDILRLAHSLRWTNEALWVFLRTMAASKLVGEPGYNEFRETCRQLLDKAEDSTAIKVLQAAALWASDYRETVGDGK